MNEHFIPNRRIPNPGPHIATPATTHLLGELDELARRQSEVTALVVAIRNGDNAHLLEVVHRAQLGVNDAALIALGTAEHLGNRLAARARRRHARQSERKWANELPTSGVDFPECSVEIDDHVFARIELATLARAATAGIIQPRQWDGIRALARAEFGVQKLKATERKRLERARRALAEHPDLRFVA